MQLKGGCANRERREREDPLPQAHAGGSGMGVERSGCLGGIARVEELCVSIEREICIDRETVCVSRSQLFAHSHTRAHSLLLGVVLWVCGRGGFVIVALLALELLEKLGPPMVNLLLSKWMWELEKVFYANIVAFDTAMLPEANPDDLQTGIWK
ncbi:hypothetical protein Tco_0364345 [Tanacetum coccineum]